MNSLAILGAALIGLSPGLTSAGGSITKRRGRPVPQGRTIVVMLNALQLLAWRDPAL